MAGNGEQSIFAVTLDGILGKFGYTIHHLRSNPFNLDGNKIDRLEGSLTSIKTFPALNVEELTTITTFIKGMIFAERMLIYAALIAMGSQRQLIDGFLPAPRAWEIAVEVRDATHRWLLAHRSEDDLLRRQRLRRLSGNGAAAPVGGTLLAEALDAYDEGMALHTVGIELDDRDRLRAAAHCYDHALALLGSLAPTLQAAPDWQFWHHEITTQRNLLRE